jgi:hypothetical protein
MEKKYPIGDMRREIINVSAALVGNSFKVINVHFNVSLALYLLKKDLMHLIRTSKNY